MDSSAWGLYLLMVAVVAAATVLHYQRREPGGRGRFVLAGLRAGALAILVLLLFDPLLPRAGGSEGGGELVLLDASLSMQLRDVEGETRWAKAVAAAGEASAERVVLFGDGERAAGPLPEEAPRGTRTRLAPALRAALETGAGRIVVITDGGVEDVAEVRRLLSVARGRVEIRLVGGESAGNVAVAGVDAPAWLEAGEEAAVAVSIARLGSYPGDSVRVVLRRAGREVAGETVAVPPEGALSTATLRFTPTAGSGEPERLEAALEGSDAEAEDDHRTVYVRVAEEPAGVALVSFRPDQEPRFLLPVLERALDVPVRGWLALPGGRYIRLGLGSEAGGTDPEAVVRRVVEGAELRVFHGLGEDAPAWALEAARRGRLLAFPSGATPALPFPVPPSQPGDWYASAELPPSPVAPLLAGVEPGDAPPLMGLRAGAGTDAGWAPLTVRLARRGPALPVLMAGEMGGRRAAVALGDGYWRWAFSGGAGRELYDRLWSAMAGWLMEGAGSVAGDGVVPAPRVVERGAPLEWRVAGAGDSLRVVLQPVGVESAEAAEAADGVPEPPAMGEDGVVLDTTVRVAGGVAVTPPLPPGRYRYEARSFGGGAGGDTTGVGELTVESYSPELTRPAVALTGAAEAAGAAGAVGGDGVARAGESPDGAGAEGTEGVTRPGRPLRTMAWPYVAVLVLLSVEWILRRRWGLR